MTPENRSGPLLDNGSPRDKHTFPRQRKARNSPVLDNGSGSTFPRQRIDAVIYELFAMVIYIQAASRLVQFRRIQSQGILLSSFVTVEEKTLVVQ
jgi:hypothetical protein